LKPTVVLYEENGLTLTTRNREDFDKVRGLRVRTP